RSDDGQDFASFDLERDAGKDVPRAVAILLVREAHVSNRILPVNAGRRTAPGFSRTSSSMSIKRKTSDDAPSACWKLLLKTANFRTGSYSLNTATMNARKVPGVKMLWAILSRPSRRSMAIAMAPKISISGELMADAATDRKLAWNRRRAAARKRAISHDSMLKAFTMRFPVIVSWRRF